MAFDEIFIFLFTVSLKTWTRILRSSLLLLLTSPSATHPPPCPPVFFMGGGGLKMNYFTNIEVS
jgi:hypothetical protein